jgi:hypothetical protein
MEPQRWTCVIDWFGKNYDGTMPSIVFACDETWLGLFPVAPPNPPAIESGDRPDGRLSLIH